MKSGLGLIWTVKQAQLYSILAKFEAKGLLTVRLDDSAQPVRKMYALAPAGRAVFTEWVRTPSQRKDFRLEFFAKLHFTRALFPESAPALVERQIALCESWLSDMRERSAAAADSGVDRLVFRFRLSQLEAMLEALEVCKRDSEKTARRTAKAGPRG